jgi:hypothetical protein
MRNAKVVVVVVKKRRKGKRWAQIYYQGCFSPATASQETGTLQGHNLGGGRLLCGKGGAVAVIPSLSTCSAGGSQKAGEGERRLCLAVHKIFGAPIVGFVHLAGADTPGHNLFFFLRPFSTLVLIGRDCRR